ncbi:MAG: Uma2 family endonuclease [Roseiflexus sp.]|uniref:Uma2 family endonuclease n=1 Tax=Roseiflexus sp. TaxID=2562120 RepID=UPI0025E7F619|nr:Uma2 family endonuclease [Roseiflexus sp.]MCL6542841.1 Uma2 family endonuclease [Roseiflexus sp.]
MTTSVPLDALPVVTAAAPLVGPPQGRWTYADYAALPDDGNRYEIIAGVLYTTPAPGAGHQSVSARLVTFLVTHVEFAGLGRVFAAPVDVELAPDTVVQPDIVVILSANLDRITPSRIIGAPDLVVEILSPGTAGHDQREKQDAYARAGVGEYWIVDPGAQTVELLTLDQGGYRSHGVFRGQARLPSSVVTLPVPIERFFQG